jgi:hypothetical protein
MSSSTAAPLVERERIAEAEASGHESRERDRPRLVTDGADQSRPGRLARAFVASSPWLMRAVVLSTVAVIVFLIVSAYLPSG